MSTTEPQSHHADGDGENGTGMRGHRHRRKNIAPGEVVRGTVRVFGEILLTSGLLMLFYAAYEVYGSQLETDREQQDLAQGLEDNWATVEETGPESDPLPGAADSRLYVPDLDLDWVVVNGTEPDDILYSPGRYTWFDSGPGQEGNYAIAAHRTPGLFWDLDLLNDGDIMVLEDGENFYTYEVFEEETVLPQDSWVVDPDPFDEASDEEPERALLTLTTCAPKLNNTHRLIVWAELTETAPKSEGMPDPIAHMASDTEE